MAELDTSQWDAFFQKAYSINKEILPIFAGALELMALDTIGELREYPEATDSNRPGRFSLKTRRAMGYYERNRGWWYPIMQEKTRNYVNNKRLGIIQAKPIHGVEGYKLQRTSEMLAKRWAHEIRVNESAGFVEAVIGNTASYQQWVQGDKQSRKMESIGWETAEQAVVVLEPVYVETLNAAVDEIVKYLQTP
jgi:hypothetical protein